MEEKLRKIMSNIFNVKQDVIIDESSMENIDKWDSLGHLKLIMAIEEKFGISIDSVDMIALTSFEKIILYLKEKK